MKLLVEAVMEFSVLSVFLAVMLPVSQSSMSGSCLNRLGHVN